ncbi:MAG: bifunctional alpha,alpha-trehalose-phosphate synthase (UDP-forming)/trehalose-phosphatase [Chitinispirillaceae bacterium]|nr:bifunctional alpha,alpha-trehalose-phosphate synthase (UDP-forming)/trehalose-phosphatase [Chitinispirillaceae bacterium]
MPVNAPSYRFKRLIVVSYRLPYKTVYRDGRRILEQNSGGLVSAMSALSEKATGSGELDLFKKVIWVGKGDAPPKEADVDKAGFIMGLLEKYVFRKKDLHGGKSGSAGVAGGVNDIYQMEEVTIDEKIEEKYYGGFCNDLIWPLFHYFSSLAVHDEAYFDNYVTANKLFAEKIKSIIQPDDFIWVHDYQLFLLPELVRRSFPSASIGFFLHIPFPAFEVFRNMPGRWRDAILKGMLGADVVGFHTYDYSQYFLRTVSRLLGNETTMNSVIVDDRVVKVEAFPIGIDYEKFHDAAANSKEVEAEKQKIIAELQNKKLIFSVDRLDYSKGLLQRLEAFEFFLETYPEWIGKIIFNMVVVPSRDTIAQYQQMKREIDAVVGRINGKYSTMAWRPIIYQYKTLSFSELVALYDISAVGLITPLRDGMNLVAKEYIASQVTEKGVLILSEMAGAAVELSEAILINPADKKEVAEALNRALSMPLRDRTILINRMQRRLKNYTVFSWAKDILESLESIKKEQQQRKVNLITSAIESEIITRFRSASQRVIFLDYDGTLVPFSRIPELAIPGAQTLKQLGLLAENRRNTVVLISGRDKEFLQEWFGTLNVHLIAEHGAFQKPPGGEWLCAIDPDQGWKTAFNQILQRYADRCNGSFIEEKFSSLAWHYRNSPPEMGQMKANELKEELRTLVAHENKLHVIEGNKVVEIKRTGYDKGVAALKFVTDRKFDFIMAIGDDRTDEDIYRSLSPDAVTIKIGITTSNAKYNMINQRGVSRLIDRLNEKDVPG